jgi:hypothetical protein
MEQKKNSKSWQPEYTAGQRGNPGQASIHDDGSIALKPGQPESTAESTTELTPDCRRIGERRKAFWRSLLYGNFRPRRRSSRRTFDQHDFLFDWHEPRVLYLALAVLLLSCTDALFTLNLLNLGATEANIVMALALEVGIDQFVQIKIILTSLSVVVLVVTARRIFFRSYRVEHALQLLAAAYLMVISYELYIFNFVFEFNLLGGV